MGLSEISLYFLFKAFHTLIHPIRTTACKGLYMQNTY